MRIAVLFHHFGPYHVARLAAAARKMNVVGIELSDETSEYRWRRVGGSWPFEHVTVVSNGDIRQRSRSDIRKLVASALEATCPDTVVVHGWGSPDARAALAWCAERQIPVVIMSESTEWDEVRTTWKEKIKRLLLKHVRAALVGGTPHIDYAVRLGISEDCVFPGYDVVDNGYFEEGAAAVRLDEKGWRERLRLPRPFFLASSRFIAKKNLSLLIEAYAAYRHRIVRSAWDLVLLGDGPQRSEVEAHCNRLALNGALHLPGFKQYDELPRFYGLAHAFVHASTTEQWGLVVNEAMAAGLPVIVSERCGCAHDLVLDGVNGFTFNPHDMEALTGHMLAVTASDEVRNKMGEASRRIIADWGPGLFASGLREAVSAASEAGSTKPKWSHRVLLNVLAGR